jgi:hypothetical protein
MCYPQVFEDNVDLPVIVMRLAACTTWLDGVLSDDGRSSREKENGELHGERYEMSLFDV